MEHVDIQQAYDTVSDDYVLLKTDYDILEKKYLRSLDSIRLLSKHKFDIQESIETDRKRIIRILNEFALQDEFNLDWISQKAYLINKINKLQ